MYYYSHAPTPSYSYSYARVVLTSRNQTLSLSSLCSAVCLSVSLPLSFSPLSHWFPIQISETLLDNDTLRVGVAIRLGLQVCEQHKCRCGATIGEFGLHPLSCRHSAGRFPRQAALNDMVKRDLEAEGFPLQLEPVGLDRGDGKRPDGLTLFPFKSGKALVWDATCTDTFAPGNIVSSAVDPGAAARSAEENKVKKYATLSDRYLFVPVAVETSGVLGPLSLSFLRDIGLGAARQRHEPRESEWLFQRISLAIVRGNAHSILSAGKDRVE